MHLILIEATALLIKIPKIITAKAIFSTMGNVYYKLDKDNPNVIIVDCSERQKIKIERAIQRDFKKLESALDEL